MPFNSITRWVLDKCMHARVMYHVLQHKGGLAKRHIVKDDDVPYRAAAVFIE
jgi:delta24-sterol reductase